MRSEKPPSEEPVITVEKLAEFSRLRYQYYELLSGGREEEADRLLRENQDFAAWKAGMDIIVRESLERLRGIYLNSDEKRRVELLDGDFQWLKDFLNDPQASTDNVDSILAKRMQEKGYRKPTEELAKAFIGNDPLL